MNIDDFLWAILGAGVLLSIAYVRAELLAHRTRRELELERFEREQLLWPSRQSRAFEPAGAEVEDSRSSGCKA
jgi:hypothetical protein